jgi:putative ABC transport system permease protein
LLEGRTFSERERFESSGVAIVNEAFAQLVDGRVLGRQLRSATPQFLYGSSAPNTFDVVGVVGNERFRGLEQPAQPAFYISTRQFPQTSLTLLVRAAGDPLALVPDIRAAAAGLRAGITFDGPTSLERILADQLATRRATTSVIGGLAGAALALAALGLYGLLGGLVASRAREIGVRLAIGASPHSAARTVMMEGLTNAAAGIAIGLAMSVGTGHWVESLLVGVSPHEPITLLVVSAVLLAVAAAAALGPAIRAARIDPVLALRGN